MKEKWCNPCQTLKPINEFGSDKSNGDGLTHRCKKCRNIESKKWRSKFPEKVKEINLRNKQKRIQYYNSPEAKMKYRNLELKRKFGITHDDYEKMLSQQNGVCLICKQYKVASNKYFMAIDHCHKTGKIRGILCTRCNTMIGLAEDNLEILENAKIYLKGNKNE